MSSIKELLDNEIYPAIFEKADEIFTEHKFKKSAEGWASQTYMFGQPHAKRKDKTVIRKNAISYITEWGNQSISIWDYVQQRDSLDQSETLIKLAEMAGIVLPSNLSPEQLEAIRINNKIAQIWADANDFFIDCLSRKDNPFVHSTKAQNLRDYLAKERGYTKLDIRMPESEPGTTLEVGFIPGQSILYKYLIDEKRHDSADVYSLVKLNNAIGDTNILTIPFRDPVGKIKGFAFRSIGTLNTDQKRYINNTGLKKDEILFGLTSKRGNKDIVIVEGLLDAGIATARGIKDVVALGGLSLTESQIKLAIKYGARRFTIALDNDAPGKKATLSLIDQLVKFGKPVYIALYPDGIKDADQLIREQGAESFQKIINEAPRHYLYTLNETLNKYPGLFSDKGEVLSKDVDEIAEFASIEASRLEPIDREKFLDEFLTGVSDIPGLAGINKDTLEAKAQDLRFNKDKERQSKEFSQLLKNAGDSLRKGDTAQAIELIEDRIHDIKAADSVSQFKELFEIDQSEAAVRERLSKTPDSVRTGFKINIEGELEDISISAGALSFIAAPTNHGKTSFLINVALNIIQNKGYDPDKDEIKDRNVYLLTFEESAEKIVAYALNAFINEKLNKGSSYRKYIIDYLKSGTTKYIGKDIVNTFLSKKDIFFERWLISKRLNIRYVDYDSDKLISYIHYIQARDPQAVILIDYIQKMRRTAKGNIPNRGTELKLICEDLETCANKTGLPMLLGAQFNRDVVSPQDMHPTRMAEASDIEKTASEIWGLWNCAKDILAGEGKKSKATEAALKYFMSDTGDKDKMILQILKSRSLRTGDHVKLSSNGPTGRIDPEISRAILF